MKKIVIILMLIMVWGSELWAQQIKAYVSGGLTFSQIEGDELRGFARHASTAGVGVITNFGEHWKGAMEVDFAMRGSYNDSGDPFSIKLPLNYVDIPVMAYYHDPYSDVNFGLGLVYGRLVQQPHGTLVANPNYFMPDTNGMNFYKNDLGVMVEMRFRLASHMYFSLRWQRSIIKVNDWTFTTPQKTWTNACYNSSASFRLQWQFGEPEGLKKRR